MLSWLHLLLMSLYAPLRGMREARDRGALAPIAFLAMLANASRLLLFAWAYPSPQIFPIRPAAIIAIVSQSAGMLVFMGLVLCPLAIFLTNLFERRASIRLVLQQEYAAFTSAVFFAFTAANLFTIGIAFIGKVSGATRTLAGSMVDNYVQQRSQNPTGPWSVDPSQLNPEVLAGQLPLLVLLALFFAFTVAAVQMVFRVKLLRSLLVVLLTGILLVPASGVLIPLFSMILGSPFLLIMLFLILRGYFTDVMRTQRARESFRQNLEAATLNPADASAHYNLGLIHQQRGELDAARERFERAIQIDDDEIDAHYQLGLIARQQNRFADAIRHFEQVVSRNASHAQREVWREVGATYMAAGQFEDARSALEQFLDHRPSDPEALYLMGRAHAGLGQNREAASLMEKCIESVRTAPAYKYRMSKRWLNEAQQFLRSRV